MAIGDKCKQYQTMSRKGAWDLISDLLGGTEAMRNARTKWLPKEPGEKQKNYNNRVKRSYLYGALADTIDKLSSRPLSKPVMWDTENEELKEAMRPIINDMDGEGMDLQAFVGLKLDTLITWGLDHVWVDYPVVPGADSLTKKDEQELELRPFNRIVAPPDMWWWTTERKVNGSPTVTEVQIHEKIVQDLPGYTQEVVDQIRVIGKGTFEQYIKTPDDDEYIKQGESGIMQIGGKQIDFLPIVTTYTKKWDLMMALPPLLDLAWANLEHWQSSSDQRNILRFVRLGMLLLSGFKKEEIQKGLIVAPNQAIFSENPEASGQLIETNGNPIKAGREDLEDIEERMEVLGLQPMIQKMGNVKATGMAISEAKSRSMLESWIRDTEKSMRKILAMNARWLGSQYSDITEDDFMVNIHSDFIFGTQASQDIKDLIEARKLGDISHETLMNALKRYGRLTDDVDPVEELERIASEAGLGVGLFSEPGTIPPDNTETGVNI